MSNPAVSILMPVRNEERFLPAALASLRAQTVTEWELVAVDDGSIDGTSAILATAAADPRVKVLTNRVRGLVNALNHGLESCRAPLIARMDGDDICHPQRLAKQLTILQDNPQIGLVAASFRHFPRQLLKIGMLAYEEWQNSLISHEQIMADIFVESPFVHPGVMFRKELVTGLCGYRDMGWAEDYDLWLRMAASGTRFTRSVEPLVYWRDKPQRATRTMAEYTGDAFRRCKLHHLRSGFLQGVTAITLAGAGKEGRAWQRLLAEEGISVTRWIDVDPKKHGRILHGAIIVPPQEITPDNGKLLVTVGTRGARTGIREWARQAGLVELKDYICVT